MASVTCFCYLVFGPCGGGQRIAKADQMLNAAEQGQGTGMQVLGNTVTRMPTVTTQNPTYYERSSSSTIYLPEILPGADPQKLQNIEDYGASMFNNPSAIKSNAMNYWYDVNQIGCRQTSIQYVGTQVTLVAYRYLEHREDKSTLAHDVPWTLQLGKFQTLGVSNRKVTRTRFDNEYDLITVIEISPFPQPRDGTFFTYNHIITDGIGGTITSYGTLNDGFATKGSVTGASRIEIRADLYRVERSYLRNPDGSPPASCPPDPPDPCVMSGVNWCDFKATGVASVVHGSASQNFGDSGVYNTVNRTMIQKYQHNPLPELSGDASVVQGLSKADALMTGTDPLAASLFGGCTGATNTSTGSVSIHEAEIHGCSGIYTGASDCQWQRKFNFVKTETKPILTVRQYCKQQDGTYIPCPISVMPNMACPGSGSPLSTCTFGYPQTWVDQIDNSTRQEYRYTPYIATNERFTWNDYQECAVGLDECKHVSSLYTITQNEIDGCDVQTLMLWDGWCQGNVTCTDYRSCVTIEDVTYCEGDPESEQKIISKMETMTYPGTHPTNAGQPVYQPMCWAGSVNQMSCSYYIGTEECYTDTQGQVHCPETDGTGFVHHEGLCTGAESLCPYFKDDCELQGLYNNDNCTYVGQECAEDASGLYSKICYSPTLVYDCGRTKTIQVPATTASAELCSSPVRCLGTECHNVRGESNADMGRAMGSLTAVEMMQNDFVCAETGQPPTDAQIQSGECSIRVFEGKRMKCKIPIGHGVGLTTDCCDEGLKAARGVNAVDYIMLAFTTVNLAKNPIVLKGLASVPGSSPVFGLFENASNLYNSATSFLKSTVTNAFTNTVEHLGFKVTSSAAEATAKEAVQTGLISGIKQKIMWSAYDTIKSVFGPELADQMFTISGGQIALNATLSMALNFISLVFTIYSLLKILAQILFPCEQDELKLGIQRKLGNCTYVGSYCAQRTLFTCIVKKKSFCCYNTPLARIIMEQARAQLGGFGSKKKPNCEGLTLSELEMINWEAIDLSEWEARLGEAGFIPQTEEAAEQRWGATNVQHLQREYGITEVPGPDGDFTKAESNQERLEPFTPTIMSGKGTLEDSKYKYVDPEQTLQYPIPQCDSNDPECIGPP